MRLPCSAVFGFGYRFSVNEKLPAKLSLANNLVPKYNLGTRVIVLFIMGLQILVGHGGPPHQHKGFQVLGSQVSGADSLQCLPGDS